MLRLISLSHWLSSLCWLIGLPLLAQRDRDTYSSAFAQMHSKLSARSDWSRPDCPATRIPVRLERFGGGLVDQMETDSGGRFRFPNLQRGYYKVIVNAPGFRPVQQDADLQVVFRAYLVFELAADKAGGRDIARRHRCARAGGGPRRIDARPRGARQEELPGSDRSSAKSDRFLSGVL